MYVELDVHTLLFSILISTTGMIHLNNAYNVLVSYHCLINFKLKYLRTGNNEKTRMHTKWNLMFIKG